MQNIFQLVPLASEEQWVLELCDHDSSGREQDLWTYTSFEKADRSIIQSFRIVKAGVEKDINFTAFGTLIVSEKFKDAFSNHIYADEMEILPVELIGHDASWYAINLLKEIDCLNYKKSKLSYARDGSILCLYEICIDMNKWPENHFFSLVNWNTCFLVSEKVQETIRAAGLTGAIAVRVQVA